MESKAIPEAACEEDPTQLYTSHETSDKPVYRTSTRKLTLPSLLQFSGSNDQDGDAFDQWVRKLSRYAELESWTDRQKLLQLELHLVGRIEQKYELLPSEPRNTFMRAVKSLRQRLHPVQNEALLSAQIMKRVADHARN